MMFDVEHVVIGAGQVGSAIAQVLATRHPVHLRDVTMSGPTRADVLHVCFPHSVGFESDVASYRRDYDPDLVIIHSTVPIGTSEALDAVHSPVRGRHPLLAQSLRAFVKFFGGPRAAEAAAFFSYCGIDVRCVPDARTTEAAKLWEVAQYGLQIVVEKQIHAFCDRRDIDFDVVYTEFARTYNLGYQSLGEAHFTRPVLTHIPGPIGGHCVVPVSGMLEHMLAELVVRLGG